MIRLAKSLIAIWAASSMTGTHAFTPAATSRLTRTVTTTALNLEGPPAGTKITSTNKKEILFDGTRFYEASDEDEDCVPEQEYCPIDPKTGEPIRLTVEEKERMFLDALQSYYVSGRQVMGDAEFDLLKEDLAWNGSDVVALNRKETTYLTAMQAYFQGKPVMSDAEFDQLREELKEEGSKIAVSKEPKCYIDTGVCTVTFTKDNFRTNLTYLPSLAILATLWLGIGYEILGGSVNPIILGTVGAPVIWGAASTFTDTFVFQNSLIAFGPCPSCEVENRIYFGDILGVEGFDKQANLKCVNCKETFIVQRRSLRASTLPKND